MSRIVVSAPGKVIIHGEHAVVYNKRALAASVNLRTTLVLNKASDGVILLRLQDINKIVEWKIDELANLSLQSGGVEEPVEVDANGNDMLRRLARLDGDTNDTKDLAVVTFLYLFSQIAVKNRVVPCLHFEVSTLLPISAGLGSSAAYSVCLATSLLVYTGHIVAPANDCSKQSWTEAELRLINKWAFMAEKIIHGRPSGIDNSVSTYGGALCFQAGQITPLKRMPKLRILLVNTKVPRSTKVLVEGVRKKHEKYREIVQPVLDSIEAITSRFESIIGDNSTEISDPEMYDTMKDLIDMNQHLLGFLGVSHPTLDEICRIASHHGLNSKLTGAGGGGCAMTLLPNGFPDEALQKLITELTDQGYECFETSVGGHGVTASTEVCQEIGTSQL